MAYSVKVSDQNGVVLQMDGNKYIIISHLNDDFASVINPKTKKSRKANVTEFMHAMDALYNYKNDENAAIINSYRRNANVYNRSTQGFLLDNEDKKQLFISCLRNNNGVLLEGIHKFDSYNDDKEPSNYSLQQFSPVVSIKQLEDAKEIDRYFELLLFEKEEWKEEFYNLLIEEQIERCMPNNYDSNNKNHLLPLIRLEALIANKQPDEYVYEEIKPVVVDEEAWSTTKHLIEDLGVTVSKAIYSVYMCKVMNLMDYQLKKLQ